MDFTRLEELRAKLKTLRPLNETEMKRLHEEFIIENTYHSNAIEGNTLTLRETALILQEGITIAEKPLRDHLEAIGHKGMPLNTLSALQIPLRRCRNVL